MKEIMLSTAALFIFCATTFIFFISQYYTEIVKKNKPSKTIFYIYLFFVVVTQFGFNIGITRVKCNCTQLIISLIGTIFPWLFVFFATVFILIKFPGWKMPFSNTFGYFVVYLFGIKSLLINKILKPVTTHVESNSTSNENPKISTENIKGADYYLAIQHIYDNPSLFINEITPENFEQFWSKFSGALFKSGAEAYKHELKKYIIIKDCIAEFMWYILSGVLSMSISYAYLNNATCTLPTSDSVIKDAEQDGDDVKDDI